jgi:hypothetical protein
MAINMVALINPGGHIWPFWMVGSNLLRCPAAADLPEVRADVIGADPLTQGLQRVHHLLTRR